MKKIITIFTIALILVFAGLLTGCGGQEPDEQPFADGDRLEVIATIFPQYDFVRQIAGDRVNLSMLLSPGAEMHGFEPTPRDMVAMNNADLLIDVGGHGDTWVAPIVTCLDRPELRTVAIMDFVTAVTMELVEGMEESVHAHDHDHSHGHSHGHDDHDEHDHGDHDHDDDHDHHHDDHAHDHDDHEYEHHHDDDDHDHEHEHEDHEDEHAHGHGHDHDHDHEEEYDEHVWTSPRNAILIVRGLTDILAELDPENADYFRANAADYIAELEELDRAFSDAVADGVRNTVVFGDRFPFRYLMDAYGLTYFAAFPGCSAETQASPVTIAFLIDKLRDEDLPYILHMEFSNLLIANVIVGETEAGLLELHSAHTISHADFVAGVTYLDVMWRNVDVLRRAVS